MTPTASAELLCRDSIPSHAIDGSWGPCCRAKLQRGQSQLVWSNFGRASLNSESHASVEPILPRLGSAHSTNGRAPALQSRHAKMPNPSGAIAAVTQSINSNHAISGLRRAIVGGRDSMLVIHPQRLPWGPCTAELKNKEIGRTGAILAVIVITPPTASVQSLCLRLWLRRQKAKRPE